MNLFFSPIFTQLVKISYILHVCSHFASLLPGRRAHKWSVEVYSCILAVVLHRLMQAVLAINSVLARDYYVDVQRRKTQTGTNTH